VTFSLGARGGDDGERGEGDHERGAEEVRGRGIQPCRVLQGDVVSLG
jgi:hypothetical protein